MSALQLAAAVALVAVLAGCGAADPAAGPSLAAQQSALKGSPPALAELHRQANQLLDGGVKAFRARLATLRGRPVVVNVWGSWCLPCRAEFPIFQRVASRVGRRIAFLGVDTDRDPRADAISFLRGHPVTYPSYADADSAIARSIKVTIGVPITDFYDRDGRRSNYQHAGPYTSTRDLEQDIARYAEGTAPRGGASG